MLRVLLELIGAFTLPFLVYALALRLRRGLNLTKKEWTQDIVLSLGLVGLALCLAILLAFFLFAERGHGSYLPAHIENGQVIPGHIEK